MTTLTAPSAFIRKADDGNLLNQLGHTAREIIHSSQTNGAYYVFEVVSPPGFGIPPHVHSREDEAIYVVDGEFEIFLGGTLHRVGPGATMNFARGTPHGFRNIGTMPGKTVWFVTPGTSFEDFFHDLAMVPPGPPDLAKVAAIFGAYGMTVLPPA